MVAVVGFGARADGFQRLLDVGDEQRDVVGGAELAAVGRRGGVEHVFEIVGAVGDAHVDPADRALRPAAAPRLGEPQDVLVEAIRGGAVANGPSGVKDAPRDALVGSGGAPVRDSVQLDELDRVAVGIADLDPPCRRRRRRRSASLGCGAARRQVRAHRGDVHLIRDVEEPLVAGGRQPVTDDEALPIVDEEDRRVRTPGADLGEAEQIAVERPGFDQIAGLDRDVRDAGDVRPRRRLPGPGARPRGRAMTKRQSSSARTSAVPRRSCRSPCVRITLTVRLECADEERMVLVVPRSVASPGLGKRGNRRRAGTSATRAR